MEPIFPIETVPSTTRAFTIYANSGSSSFDGSSRGRCGGSHLGGFLCSLAGSPHTVLFDNTAMAAFHKIAEQKTKETKETSLELLAVLIRSLLQGEPGRPA